MAPDSREGWRGRKTHIHSDSRPRAQMAEPEMLSKAKNLGSRN
jgi:hypothetical protein